MPVQLISFSSIEIDTVIVRQFIKGTNFQVLKDSILIDSSNCSYVMRGADSVELATGNSIGRLTTGLDYEIYIPSVKSLSKITDLTEQPEEGPCGRCNNFIKSYAKNGQVYNTNQLFITK